MKKLIFCILIIILCISALTLIACNEEDNTTAEPIITYNINYELNGGTNNAENPSTYKTGDVVSLNFATREDYMFAGWYENLDFTTFVREINNREENLTLYAKWVPYEDVFEFQEEAGVYSVKITPDYEVETVIIPSQYKGIPVIEITRTAEKYHKLFKTVIIPDTVTSIGIEAFSNAMDKDIQMCLEHISVDSNNPNYKSVDGVLYSKDGEILIQYPASKSGESFNIPEGVTTINDFAFSRNEKLKSITIPDSVIFIGGCAFDKTVSLESIVIPDSVKKIGGYAFHKCTSLKSVTLSSSIESIEYYTFQQCTALESIIIPSSVKFIGAWAFDNCSALERIVISDSVTSMSVGAFSRCTSVESVTIPKSVIEMDGSAFQDCPQLTLYCESNSMPEGWEPHIENNVKEIIWGWNQKAV